MIVWRKEPVTNLRRSYDVTLSLDCSSPEEDLPVRFAGGNRESGGKGNDLSPLSSERQAELGKPHLIAED